MLSLRILSLSFLLNPFVQLNASTSDYAECILENMEGVKSDIAAEEIRFACLEKYGQSDESRLANAKSTEADSPHPASINSQVAEESSDLGEFGNDDETKFDFLGLDDQESSGPISIFNGRKTKVANKREIIDGSVSAYAGFTEEELSSIRKNLSEEMLSLRDDRFSDLSLVSPSSIKEIKLIKTDLEKLDLTSFVSRSQELVQSLLIRNAAESEWVVEEITSLVLSTRALTEENKIGFLEGYLKYYLSSMPRFYVQQTNRQELAEKKRNTERLFKKYVNLSLQLYLLAIEIEPVPIETLGTLLRYMSVSWWGGTRFSAIKTFYEEAIELVEDYDIPNHLVSGIYLDYADLLVLSGTSRKKRIKEAYQRYSRSLGVVENGYSEPEMLRPYFDMFLSDSYEDQEVDTRVRVAFEISTQGRISKLRTEGPISKGEKLAVKRFFVQGKYRPGLRSGMPVKCKVSFSVNKSELIGIVNSSIFFRGRHPFLIKGIRSIPLPQITMN